MMKYLILTLLSFCTLHSWTPFKEIQRPTSSFLENRGNRYHAGVDLSTNDTEGLPIYAPESGYVFRVRQSPWGYGKAIYFMGESKTLYVFAHLSGFTPQVWKYVLAKLQKYESLSMDGRPKKELYKVPKGSVLGFSGSTGIGEPHLHIETRDGESKVINPYQKGLKTLDTIPPTLNEFWVNNFKHNQYQLYSPKEDTLYIPSKFKGTEFNLGLNLVDWAEPHFENPMSIHSIEIKQNKSPYFIKKYRQQYYGKMNQIKSEILYDDSLQNGDWHLVNTKLNKIINTSSKKSFKGIKSGAKLILKDDNLNESSYSIVFSDKKLTPITSLNENTFSGRSTSSFKYTKSVKLLNNEQKVSLKKASFNFHQQKPFLKDSLLIDDSTEGELRFSPLGLYGNWEYCFKTKIDSTQKWGIFYQSKKGHWESFSSRVVDSDQVCSKSKDLRNVKLFEDSNPPEVTPLKKDTLVLNGKKEVSVIFKVKDLASGISSSKGIKTYQKLKGKWTWIYSEFKGDKDLLFIPLKYLKSKQLKLVVRDDYSNSKAYYYDVDSIKF